MVTLFAKHVVVLEVPPTNLVLQNHVKDAVQVAINYLSNNEDVRVKISDVGVTAESDSDLEGFAIFKVSMVEEHQLIAGVAGVIVEVNSVEVAVNGDFNSEKTIYLLDGLGVMDPMAV